MLDPARKAAYLARSLPRQERRCLKITDNALLLAFLRHLVYKLSDESGNLNQWVSRSEIFRELPNLPKRCKKYFSATRRLLRLGAKLVPGIPGLTHNEDFFKLPKGWKKNLYNATGLPVTDPACLQEFRRLRPNLCMDSVFRAYSDAHPIIARMQACLCGALPRASHQQTFGRTPLPANVPKEAAHGIQHLAQIPADDAVLERFVDKLRNGQLAANHLSEAEFYALLDPNIPSGQLTEPETDLVRDPQLVNAVSLMTVARSHLARKIKG